MDLARLDDQRPVETEPLAPSARHRAAGLALVRPG